jgi:hypothetical protein
MAESDKDAGELTSSQLAQTQDLMTQINITIDLLAGAKKLGVEKRSNILAKLIKAQADLVKTQRTLSGLDRQIGPISAGVIIIPGKSDNWMDDAKAEIDNAHKLIHGDDEESEV